MSYATGSGDYTALMAAVLSFAIADGWTTTGGTWPISKGNVRGVDWSTFTATEFDRTFTGANISARYLNIGIGTTPAGATTNAASTTNSVQVPNMHYTFTNWWIFSDPASGYDFIHVVFQFSNGVNGDCFGHFSFGEINKHGMGHTAVIYATCGGARGYSATNEAGNTSRDWNSGLYSRSRRAFVGNAGYTFSASYNYKTLVYIVDGTISPFPPASGWPAVDVVNDQTYLYDHFAISEGAISSQGISRSSNVCYRLTTHLQYTLPAPYSGAISFAPIPFTPLNGTGSGSSIMMLGSFQGVRLCNIEGYNAGDELTFGSETWKVFPYLRSTDWTQCHLIDAITSGRAAFAYKKVA